MSNWPGARRAKHEQREDRLVDVIDPTGRNPLQPHNEAQLAAGRASDARLMRWTPQYQPRLDTPEYAAMMKAECERIFGGRREKLTWLDDLPKLKNGQPSRGRPMLEKLSRQSEWRGECRVWLRHTSPLGYARVYDKPRLKEAHRVAYELFIGPIPAGLHLDHLCRNPSCINPAHLEPVTPAENTRRAAAAITHCPQGHPYADGNLYWNSKGYRECRVCIGVKSRRQYLARKARKDGYGDWDPHLTEDGPDTPVGIEDFEARERAEDEAAGFIGSSWFGDAA